MAAGGAAGTAGMGTAGGSVGGAPTSTMSTGSVMGKELGLMDGAANERVEATSMSKPNERTRTLSITLASVANACSYYMAGDKPASTQYLALGFVRRQNDGADPPAIDLGTYKVGPIEFTADKQFILGGAVGFLDATCKDTNAVFDGVNGGSGTVTIAQNDAQFVSGSFDVTDKAGEKFTGTFHVPRCTVPSPAPMGVCKLLGRGDPRSGVVDRRERLQPDLLRDGGHVGANGGHARFEHQRDALEVLRVTDPPPHGLAHVVRRRERRAVVEDHAPRLMMPARREDRVLQRHGLAASLEPSGLHHDEVPSAGRDRELALLCRRRRTLQHARVTPRMS